MEVFIIPILGAIVLFIKHVNIWGPDSGYEDDYYD